MGWDFLILRAAIFLFGLLLVLTSIYSAIRTFVLPRSAPDPITRLVFLSTRALFALRLKFSHSYLETDRVMAFYAPVALLALLPIWLSLVLTGYSLMLWSLGGLDLYQAFRASGSSLLTLGFLEPDGWLQTVLEFSEATIGLILVALLIAYLPTIYAGFSRREAQVTLLEVRAGTPPWGITMIQRYHRIHSLEKLGEEWQTWERWFAELAESHTSLSALIFFRSPQPNHSWVTAAGAVLDAAAFTLSTLDIPTDPRAALCLRAGYLALRQVSDFFGFPYPSDPHFPNDPISISEAEFLSACDLLAAEGVPIKPNRKQAWQDFAGWRVNYDLPLVTLARLTLAPQAPWSGSRTGPMFLPPIRLKNRSKPISDNKLDP
jgi:hypothetical protein